MKYMKVLIILLVVILSSCSKVDIPSVIDCDVTPEHAECVVDVVDCDVTPEHAECVVDVVDCEVTPNHEDCVVDCEVTPLDPVCVDLEPIVIESCETRGITDCLFVVSEAFSNGTFVAMSSYDKLGDADTIM